jgi:hypothetical protein
VRETIVHCDRCAATMTEGAALLAIEAGLLRDRLHTPVDLCEACAAKLLEWLATAPTPIEKRGNRPLCNQANSGFEMANS